MEASTLLGGKKVLKRTMAGQHDMREVLRSGLPLDAFDSLVNTLGISATEIIKVLGMAPRTFARRKDQRGFTPAESDRLSRLARVASMAIQVLGSIANARQWLERPNRALGGETPLGLLDTDIGARQVEAVLGRIEHGVFS
jgi:putative toxin-antitoxin system antitoxin component (TIGR02293 family)